MFITEGFSEVHILEAKPENLFLIENFTTIERNGFTENIDVKWTAKQTFIGWDSEKTFMKDTTYTRIPYTQQTRIDGSRYRGVIHLRTTVTFR